MRRLLLLALCALFALNAEARTLYVNASRPNNRGNGLSAKKAKKTLQAAINIARKGDTILVYPGTYARIKSNNRKIVIKSVDGKASTRIVSGKDKHATGFIVADLAAWAKNVEAYQVYWNDHWHYDAWKMKKSAATTVRGFTLRPTCDLADNGGINGFNFAAAIAGGVAKDCAFEYCHPYPKSLAFPSPSVPGGLELTQAWPTFLNTKLVGCRVFYCMGVRETEKGVVSRNSGVMVEGSTFVRCSVSLCGQAFDGGAEGTRFRNSTFVSCLFSDWNDHPAFVGCTLLNCTAVDNEGLTMKSTKAYNSIFHDVSASQFRSSKKNTFKNCLKGGDPGFVQQAVWPGYPFYDYVSFLEEPDYYAEEERIFTDKTSPMYDRNWVTCEEWSNMTKGDYRLRPDSSCIDGGRLTKARKKLVGTKDLAGRKRIKGKAIDIGCYEY